MGGGLRSQEVGEWVGGITVPNAVLSPSRMILHSGIQVCTGCEGGITTPNAALSPPRTILHSDGQQCKPL